MGASNCGHARSLCRAPRPLHYAIICIARARSGVYSDAAPAEIPPSAPNVYTGEPPSACIFHANLAHQLQVRVGARSACATIRAARTAGPLAHVCPPGSPCLRLHRAWPP
ncbi:hypothetical protein FA95DRAFT_1565484 [Auriscalpium vulgare]|uniref:Uncharacterized protein n=2 Tax=Auriscalpium vulgare TaxID=40419 RepID=A0ACB8R9N2_9AGAM|nr:hypothetical protein FA95DRAFT_1566255 [Auriscalpium vulgare]KAI0041340.1 hypothetical protein FA95DRAFT_1565484 [Auriscalpium vulgare]